MNTGENEQGLRKILDLTRMGSLALLGLHYYYYCYQAFDSWGLRSALTDRILANIAQTGLFATFAGCKVLALLLLAIALCGVRGQKKEKLQYRTAGAYIAGGMGIYFGSSACLLLVGEPALLALAYMGTTTAGYILLMTGGTLLSRVIRQRLHGDIFNKENETFPQEERRLDNPYSINLPAHYALKGKLRRSWINVINPF